MCVGGISCTRLRPASHESTFGCADINPWFGSSGKGNSLKGVVENFSKLRKAGVVLHYWS